MKRIIILFVILSLSACARLEFQPNYSGKKLRKLAAVSSDNLNDKKWAEMLSISLLNAGFSVVEQDFLRKELHKKGYDYDKICESKQYSLIYYLLGIEGLVFVDAEDLDLKISVLDTESEQFICTKCFTSATVNLNSMSKQLAEKML